MYFPKIKGVFEKYDWRLGCLAIRKDDRWWIVIPTGEGIPVHSEEEARNGAQYINLTATDKEREEWK